MPRRAKKGRPIRAIDLCAGAGGWACAARGLPDPGVEVVLAVDMWEPACRTYGLNHPRAQVLQADLREATVRRQILRLARELGPIALVLGGIPCEWLSVYRTLQQPTEEEIARERDTLDSVLALVEEIGPTWWCLEDVAGIVKELPPFTPHVQIDAAEYSAQRRKRTYVGRFPLPPKGDCADTLASRMRPGPYRIGRRCFDRKPVRRRNFTRDCTLAAELDRKAPTVVAISSRRDAELAVVDPSLPSGDPAAVGKRQMEWQEAATLQGFPDDYLFWGSPTDVGIMVGRAIQIDTGRAILRAIVNESNTPRGRKRKERRR